MFSLENSGSYIESLINFWGISNDDLFKVTTKRIRDELLKNEHNLPWPPTVETLTNIPSKVDEDTNALSQFLSLLTNNKKNTNHTKVNHMNL